MVGNALSYTHFLNILAVFNHTMVLREDWFPISPISEYWSLHYKREPWVHENGKWPLFRICRPRDGAKAGL